METTNELYTGFLECRTRQLVMEESATFMGISRLRLEEPTMTQELRDKIDGMFCYKVMSKRLEIFDRNGRLKETDAELRNTVDILPVDPYVYVWLATLCKTPREAVVWAYTLYLIYLKHGSVTLDLWVRYFPNGIPTASEQERVWDAQKIGGANFVDQPQSWPKTLPDDRCNPLVPSPPKTKAEVIKALEDLDKPNNPFSALSEEYQGQMRKTLQKGLVYFELMEFGDKIAEKEKQEQAEREVRRRQAESN